jgi:hypothetical protein
MKGTQFSEPKTPNDMTTSINTCYNNFINYMMASTGLPISQMQTKEEWVANRLAQFEDQAEPSELKAGFEAWLSGKYN